MNNNMGKIILLQLPVPGLEWRRRTGNIPLAGAFLTQAVSDLAGPRVHIMPQSTVSYLGDAALIRRVEESEPDLVGFSTYCWNVDRSAYIAAELKKRLPLKTVAGGPEITPDNDRGSLKAFDTLVCGEGEGPFRALVSGRPLVTRQAGEGEMFKTTPNPYMSGLLEHDLEDMVLLETQRGCPHRCAYCYYNKSIRRSVFAPQEEVMEFVRWAVVKGVSELYLLDPCLDARPDLKPFLKALCKANKDSALSIVSEIRAESVDDETAELFAACNFKLFEIGLQSTNPTALSLMRRRTDLRRFVDGVTRLRKRGISTRIDLIAGLPGDDLGSFKRSVDFVVENGLHEDIQVFPLALLPGTEFRLRHRELGIEFSREPPYTVREVPGFTEQDMMEAFSYTEDRCGISLNPMPLLDIPYRKGPDSLQVGCLDFEEGPYVCRVVISGTRPKPSLEETASRLTFPYQVTFLEGSLEYAGSVLEILTSLNPFTPVEIVLHEPGQTACVEGIADLVKLRRPHYLDLDLRFMFQRPGNRAALFTVVSEERERVFSGDMVRQVYWWRGRDLPGRKALDELMELDGVLLDPFGINTQACMRWQEDLAPVCDELPAISFAQEALQRRWLRLTASDQICRGELFR
jgi:hypothetical protein